jgi:sugar lactone lactonase YvrE
MNERPSTKLVRSFWFPILFATLAGCASNSTTVNNPTPPAQINVVVSSTSTSVLLGATQQFIANVNGTSNSAVTWSVNGIQGGNSTAGTIDTNGLYTAPADLPNPTTVTIKATSQANNSISGTLSSTVTSDVSVALATNPAPKLSVPLSSTVSLVSSISSKGNPDQKLTWSVNGIANGNSAFGTILFIGSSGATYQAPATLPTPFTVTISATSVADATKSASVSVIIAGTIASVTQTISAGSGGTITLPDGSNVTVAPNVLPSDQALTLSEVSVLPSQPPNPAITGVGAGLMLTFATPVQFDVAPPPALSVQSKIADDRSNVISTAPSAFQFSINTATNSVPRLNGSLPTANLVDTLHSNNFTGVDGNYDSTMATATGTVRTDLLTSFANNLISEIQFSAMNITNLNGLQPLVPGAVSLGQVQGSPKWVPYVTCPTGKTLLLVHGMLSSVQGAFPADDARSIQMAGGNTNYYDSVVGFNYNWLQSITASGANLATFLNTLTQCPGLTLDIEAHSEGVPVSMAALSQPNPQVRRMIFLGGPIMGTQAANDFRILQAFILATSGLSLPTTVLDLASIRASPFVSDLRTSTRNDGSTLDGIRSALVARSQKNDPQLIVVGGTAQRLVILNQNFLGETLTITVNMAPFSQLIGTSNFDGIIPLSSALAFDSGLQVYPLFFNVGHTELPTSNFEMIGQEAIATRTPSLVCESSAPPNCSGVQQSSFIFTGSEFNFDPASITILSQGSDGGIVALPKAGLQDASGNINWSMPICSEVVGLHSIFAFDTTLASNNIMQTVGAGNCIAGSPDTVTTVAGIGMAGYSGDSGPASKARLSMASGVAFDPSGNMFIADFGNNVIRKVDVTTNVITTVAGTGAAGFFGDGGPAIKAQFNGPTHVAIDGLGNLYVADAGNERIRKIDITGLITTVAGTGLAGFSGDGGLATNAQLNFPDGIGLDLNGNLYIGDVQNNRIRKVTAATGIITTVAGNGSTGFSGDGGLATNAELSFPSRPAIDSAGNLYIADFQNNRVRRVDATTQVIVTVAGDGIPGFTGDGGSARTAELNGPLSVTVDTAGNLYIADINNSRIRVVNTGTASITVAGIAIQPGNIATIAGDGMVGYQGDGGPATSAELNTPTGLILSSAGNLYFADSKNNVIRVISLQ